MRLLVLILMVPSVASAQVADCPGCVVGIYDDPWLTRNFGDWDHQIRALKSLYVGIRFEPHSGLEVASSTLFEGFVGVQFSTAGIRELDTFPPIGLHPAIHVVNRTHFPLPSGLDIRTPEDEANGTGGMTLAWNTRGSRDPRFVNCLQGTQLLMQVDIFSLTSIPTDVVFRIRQKFPQSDPQIVSPLLWKRDAPRFTPTRVVGGCYVLNPTVAPGDTVGDPPCEMVNTSAIETATWSMIRRLYDE